MSGATAARPRAAKPSLRNDSPTTTHTVLRRLNTRYNYIVQQAAQRHLPPADPRSSGRMSSLLVGASVQPRIGLLVVRTRTEARTRVYGCADEHGCADASCDTRSAVAGVAQCRGLVSVNPTGDEPRLQATRSWRNHGDRCGTWDM